MGNFPWRFPRFVEQIRVRRQGTCPPIAGIRSAPLALEGHMAALDQLIPDPHLVELDRLRVSAPAEAVWETARHSALAQAWPIRALFALRSAMMRDSAGSSPTIRIDDLRSSADRPGFQILIDDPPRELAVGAIGKVWRLKIPFVHVAGAQDYALFRQPGFVKVAWALRVTPLDTPDACHVEIEVRVHATDKPSWRKFRCYFWVIGPFSRFIRRSLLKAIARAHTQAPRPRPLEVAAARRSHSSSISSRSGISSGLG